MLSGVMVVADTIVGFKRISDLHMNMQGIEGHGSYAVRPGYMQSDQTV